MKTDPREPMRNYAIGIEDGLAFALRELPRVEIQCPGLAINAAIARVQAIHDTRVAHHNRLFPDDAPQDAPGARA
jgi:hypothetical protein